MEKMKHCDDFNDYWDLLGVEHTWLTIKKTLCTCYSRM